MAMQRGFEIVGEYIDHGISGTKNRRPGLDSLMTDARRGKFDIVMTWAATASLAAFVTSSTSWKSCNILISRSSPTGNKSIHAAHSGKPSWSSSARSPN